MLKQDMLIVRFVKYVQCLKMLRKFVFEVLKLKCWNLLNKSKKLANFNLTVVKFIFLSIFSPEPSHMNLAISTALFSMWYMSFKETKIEVVFHFYFFWGHLSFWVGLCKLVPSPLPWSFNALMSLNSSSSKVTFGQNPNRRSTLFFSRQYDFEFVLC